MKRYVALCSLSLILAGPATGQPIEGFCSTVELIPPLDGESFESLQARIEAGRQRVERDLANCKPGDMLSYMGQPGSIVAIAQYCDIGAPVYQSHGTHISQIVCRYAGRRPSRSQAK